jgi:HTH-type transcriptional regulator / antitoxin HipB
MQRLVTETNLGYLLKDARKSQGLTQSEAARAVGLDQTAISRIETGRHVLRLDTLFKLLAALDYELLLQPRERAAGIAKDDQW